MLYGLGLHGLPAGERGSWFSSLRFLEVPETIAKPATREGNSSSEESELEEGESAECKHVSHTQLMRLLNCGIAWDVCTFRSICLFFM